MSASDKPLKMVTCSGCEAKVFIPGDLAPLASVPCSKCGQKIMMPMQIRQYELRSKIATGGQGKVYRAFDTVLERLVAVKLMRMELENDPVALANFYREARACASLNHTNIIHIYSFDELEGQRYLVMELADRGSMDSRIEQHQRLAELEVLDIGYKIASALDSGLAALRAAGFGPDYLELRDAADLSPVTTLDRPARLLAAARLGRTRLIDNVPVTPP